MQRIRRSLIAALALAVLVAPSVAAGAGRGARAAARPSLQARLDAIVAGRSVSVAIGDGGKLLAARDAATLRTPASVEKLLMSIALLGALGPDATLPTEAVGVLDETGVVQGDLWIVGHGDPLNERADVRALALALRDAGVTAVTGSVLGDTARFERDWWADGWRSYFPGDEVALPTALTYLRNRAAGGKAVDDPEARFAAMLVTMLSRMGISVAIGSGSGEAPADLPVIASIQSQTLAEILATTLGYSDNFAAETLGKALGAASGVGSASIAGAGDSIEAWAASVGVQLSAFDSSGLSYSNRVSAKGIVRLLADAETRDWGGVLIEALPSGGEGTLVHRLADVPVRAKTGTLNYVSALAGWVWSDRRGAWVEFAIFSSGLDSTTAHLIEDRVVRLIATRA